MAEWSQRIAVSVVGPEFDGLHKLYDRVADLLEKLTGSEDYDATADRLRQAIIDACPHADPNSTHPIGAITGDWCKRCSPFVDAFDEADVAGIIRSAVASAHRRWSVAHDPDSEEGLNHCGHALTLMSVDDGSCTHVVGSDGAGGFKLCGYKPDADAELNEDWSATRRAWGLAEDD